MVRAGLEGGAPGQVNRFAGAVDGSASDVFERGFAGEEMANGDDLGGHFPLAGSALVGAEREGAVTDVQVNSRGSDGGHLERRFPNRRLGASQQLRRADLEIGAPQMRSGAVENCRGSARMCRKRP